MADLVELRAEVETARAAYENIAITNTWGKTPGELVQMDMALRLAQRRYDDACGIYNRAIEDAINER